MASPLGLPAGLPGIPVGHSRRSALRGTPVPGQGRSAVSADCRCAPWASSGSAWIVRSSDSARITSAATSSIPLPCTPFSSGSSCERVSMLPSVTLASASGLGSFCVVMPGGPSSEALLLGAQAEAPGDVLHVLERLPLRQAAQVGQAAVGGVVLGRAGYELVLGRRPDLLAE